MLKWSRHMRVSGCAVDQKSVDRRQLNAEVSADDAEGRHPPQPGPRVHAKLASAETLDAGPDVPGVDEQRGADRTAHPDAPFGRHVEHRAAADRKPSRA